MVKRRTSKDEMDSEVLLRGMERLVIASHRDGEKRERFGLHASDVLSAGKPFCLRKCVLSHAYVPNAVELSAQQLNIFGSGDDMHRRWQRVLTQVALEIEQQHILEGPGMRYTPDVIVVLPAFMSLDIVGPCLVELKGYNDEEYKRLIDHPFPPYDAYRQGQLYRWCLNIQHMLIGVENKNTQGLTVWRCYPDDESIADIVARLEQVRAASLAYQQSELVLPERLCQSRYDKLAKQCSMRSACFAEAQQRQRMLLPIEERFRGVW